MNLIQMQTADVGDWKDQGGNTGSISPMNGNLIVTNTAQAHREIEGLLNKMREVRALQIAIEARLINVDLEWFEQIGIDFDLYFNSNPAMYDAAVAQDPNFQLRDFFFQNIPGSAPPQGNSNIGRLRNPVTFTGIGQQSDLPGAVPNTGGAVGVGNGGDIDYTYPGQFFNPVGVRREGEAYGSSGESNGFSPVNVQQEGLPLVNALAAASQSPFVLAALGSPALSTGFTYLDDVQIDLLVQATQADQRNSVLTAPRLTLFNGQRSWISIAKGITYVSGLEPITGNNAAGFEPITNVVFEGFVLDLDAVISADRRYVTMNVRFGLNENVNFTPVTVTGAAGGGGGDGGGGRAAQFSGTIQLPSLQGSEIRTSVSVPDKGTIMLGGQILMNEIEIEVGVPVLSKIPIVNRFFTNRLTTRSEKTQMLLIRPEIMIQQEMEDDLFPDLRSQLGEGSAGGF
jgi:type II secretory pathway component GspD/PulD (secretin)